MTYKYLNSFGFLLKASAEKGILLLISAFCAFIMANYSCPDLYKTTFSTEIGIRFGNAYFSMSIKEWIDDFGMAIFFMIIGIEIKRELNYGNLSTWSQRLLPFIAALVGVIAPAVIYSYYNYNYGHESTAIGWAIPTATDIAFALAIFSIFGASLPASLRIFLTALAIIDDLVAVVLIACVYSSNIQVVFLICAAIALLCLFLAWWKGVMSVDLYCICGVVVWYCFYRSGVHATVSGVLLGLIAPIATKDASIIAPAKRIEKKFGWLVSYFILPAFAFANSGINADVMNYHNLSHYIVTGIAAALFFGKQLGIFAAILIMTKLRIAPMPKDSTYFQCYCVSIICGIGFTMSMFINMLAFVNDPLYSNLAQFGIIVGSSISAFFGAIMLKIGKTLRL